MENLSVVMRALGYFWKIGQFAHPIIIIIVIIIVVITITKFLNWLSTALISALIGQLNRIVRIMPK